MRISHRIDGDTIVGCLALTHYENTSSFPTRRNITKYIQEKIIEKGLIPISDCEITYLPHLSAEQLISFHFKFKEQSNIEFFIERLQING